MKDTYVIKQEQLLKDFMLHHYSKKTLKAIKNTGDLLVNNVHQTVRYVLQVNDVLTVIHPYEQIKLIPQDIHLDIVYEDDYFLVINKQANLPCIPTKSHPKNTLANALAYYYKQNNTNATVHLVNRLDKDTKGLLLVAKSRHLHHLMSKDIKQVTRIYHCLVKGRLEGSGTIDKKIARSDNGIKRIISDDGKVSITHWKSLQANDESSLIECRLETGRTHQIRVHLASINHPLVNDELYGGGKGQYYLESIVLKFVHPIFNKEIVIDNRKRDSKCEKY